MKKTFMHLLTATFVLLAAGTAGASEQTLWGPNKYDVKERYGKDNRYTDSFSAVPGISVIKLQNGAKSAERVDLISFSLNGEQLISTRHTEYNYLACFVMLQKENKFELNIRDYTPQPLKRPPAIPKNAALSVVPAPVKLPAMVLGLMAWDDLNAYTSSLFKIKNPESFSLAVASADLKNDPAARSESIRRLAERKDPATLDYLMYVLRDTIGSSEVRSAVAVAMGVLGNKSVIPALMQAVVDPEDQIRTGAARGLALFPEQDTKDLLAKTLERMDMLMSAAVIRSIVIAGWRPIGTLIGFAESKDPVMANMGIELLTGAQEQRVTEQLLKYLDAPGPRDVKLVIRALGETKDKSVVAALTAFAGDPVKRRGTEVELAGALAKLGDPASEALIADMIKNTEHWPTRRRLLESYRLLTGRDYK